jgi:benzodiazapine receptor
MLKKISGAFFWILAFQLIGYYIGKVTKQNIPTWYQTLNKSILNPPEVMFPIVWSILYLILAFIGWSLWLKRNETRGKLSLITYGIQMLMNWAWTPIFFSFHLIAVGFYWIIAMAILTLILIFINWKHNKFISNLLIPYCLWLLFAGYLNWAIWVKN